MHKDFLYYYNFELEHLRKMCGEFTDKNPKIAARLSMNEFECNDPYVERLIQGFSYLAAGAHQKLDDEYSKISRALLDNLFPDFLLPVPPMGIVKIAPDYKSGISPKGIVLKKTTALKSESKDASISKFVTGHEVKLFPVDIKKATYYTDDMAFLKLAQSDKCKSCLLMELDLYGESKFKDLNMEELVFYISHNSDAAAMDLYRLLLSHCNKIIIRDQNKKYHVEEITIPNTLKDKISPVGFDKSDALYRFNSEIFEGFRLIQRFMFFHRSFMFAKLRGIKKALQNIRTKKAEIIFVFEKEFQHLKKVKINEHNFQLYCSPVINLYKETIKKLNISTKNSEYEISNAEGDKEVVKILKVEGIKEQNEQNKIFLPLHSNRDFLNSSNNDDIYYITKQHPVINKYDPENENKIQCGRLNTYISFVDRDEKSVNADIKELNITTLRCNRNTEFNRHKGNTELHAESNVPISSINCIYGPTKPFFEHLFVPLWKIVNHISLNWTLLQDSDGTKNAKILKEIFKVYTIDSKLIKSIDTLKSVKLSKSTHRVVENGEFTFANGITVDIFFEDRDNANFCFLTGLVLENFFVHAEPINTVVQTVVKTEKLGEIYKSSVRKGRFPLI